MSANSRLTIAAHILAWMELDRRGGHEVATSERIAGSVNTNPVVIRRCLGDLRKAGLVEARRGAGAGWSLVLRSRVDQPARHPPGRRPGPPVGMHHTPPNEGCPVGYGIQPALRRVYGGLEETVQQQLAQTTVADVLRDVLAQRV